MNALRRIAPCLLAVALAACGLGSGSVDAGTGKAPGVAVPLVVAAATGNPIGLIVSSAVKAEGQISGRTTIEGAAKRTADEIVGQLRLEFQRQGWT